MYFQSFHFRIFPNDSQKNKLAKTFGACRFVYNYGRDLRYSSEKYLSIKYLYSILSELIKTNSWLNDTCGDAIRLSLASFDRAYKLYCSDVTNYPGHKSLKHKQSFVISGRFFRYDDSNHKVILDKIGAIDVEKRFLIPSNSKVKTVIVQKSLTNKYYIIIYCKFKSDLPSPEPIEQSSAIGLDLGISSLVTTSDGRKFENKEFLRHSLEKRKILLNKMSQKKPGSKNYEELHKKLLLLQEKTKHQRRDYYQKIVHELTNDPKIKTICVEDLSPKRMVSINPSMKIQIYDAAFGVFNLILRNKCQLKGINYIVIDKHYKSSQYCSYCGYVNSKLTLKDREWKCPRCGKILDRDINAARNIRNYGICQ